MGTSLGFAAIAGTPRIENGGTFAVDFADEGRTGTTLTAGLVRGFAGGFVTQTSATGVSQSVFAHVLNVTTNYVSQLERDSKKPAGPTLSSCPA